MAWSAMPDFDALLLAGLAVIALAAGLAVHGNLTVSLRRRPQPRKPQETKP
jgi:hypothetical protein